MNTGTTESLRKTIFLFALTLLAGPAFPGWTQAQGNTPDDVDDEISVLIGDLTKPGPSRRDACRVLARTSRYRGKAKRAIPALLKILEVGEEGGIRIPMSPENKAVRLRLVKEGRRSRDKWQANIEIELRSDAITALKANGIDVKTAAQPLTNALRNTILELDNALTRFQTMDDVNYKIDWQANKLVVEISKLLASAGAEADAAVPMLLNVVRAQVPPLSVREMIGDELDAFDDDEKAVVEARAAADPKPGAKVYPLTRVAAIEALGAIGSEGALEPLLRVRAYETEPAVKEAAGPAIAAIRRAQSERIKAAARVARDGDSNKPTAARGSKPGADGEPKPSQPVIKAYLRNLGDADPQVRREVAEALGGLGVLGRSAAPGLRKALRDKDETVREAAAKALEQIFAADYNQ
jgi:HEAT repeat protein